MTFPETRLTLIQRLAAGGGEEDWRCLLKDYWGPVCRFALRWGARDLDEAEELASQTFQILLENRLLTRWVANRSAKLRSLLCRVVRNLLANRNRVQAGRRRLAPDLLEHFKCLNDAKEEQNDAFYAAWVEDMVQQSVESLAKECHAKSKGDIVRVLYGRLCRRLTNAQVAESLQITPAVADHYYREARRRLATNLEESVRSQLERYCPAQELETEFAAEWQQLRLYLTTHGGVEEAVHRAYELLDPVQVRDFAASTEKALNRLTSSMRGSSPGNLATGQDC